MSTVDQLVEEARTLSRVELDELMYRLNDFLEDRPPLSPAWEAEIEHRAEDARLGRARFVDWDEARARLRGDAAGA